MISSEVAEEAQRTGFEKNDHTPLGVYIALFIIVFGVAIFAGWLTFHNELSLMESDCDYTFGWRYAQEICGNSSVVIEKNLIYYDKECYNGNNDRSEWCTLTTKGMLYILAAVISGLNIVTILTPLGIIVCCTPKSCFTKLNCVNNHCYDCECYKGTFCLDELCCGGLCLRITSVMAMIISGVFYLACVIIWGRDNPLENTDGEICSDIDCSSDIEWGLTWWGLLFVAITYFILAGILTYKDGCTIGLKFY